MKNDLNNDLLSIHSLISFTPYKIGIRLSPSIPGESLIHALLLIKLSFS